MNNKRQWPRTACTTPACWNDGELLLIGNWHQNDYCDYIMAECPDCGAGYWMVRRDGKCKLKWRKNEEEFDHRKDDRKDC